ncbi:MAG: Gfo/Idh/MocA family oxidoreductase [Lachnospiraceae bacterium]|nr:Gfo/Idh/MocA family oxidoreductase [Lachnospiraceae bacterium]
MKCKAVHTAVVGAGAISDIYLKNMMTRFSILKVDAICASHLEHAQKKAEKYGIKACTLEEILEDDAIEMIVNLTPAFAHAEIIRKALLAGKHVYTEKTLTADLKSAAELVQLADEKKLYLGAAPDTFLGSALQTARRAIDEGVLGEVTSFAVSANRDNDVLLSMFSFLRTPGAGICMDYGVYYLTALVSLLGPVAQVASMVRAPYPKHLNIWKESPEYGDEMDTPNESRVSAVLQFKNGVTGTVHLDADSALEDQAFMTIYGTKGILYLTDPNQFGGTIKFLPNPKQFDQTTEIQILPSLENFSDNSRGVGPAEMAWAIREGRKSRVDKQMAYHVLEVLCAILESGEKEQYMTIHSDCTRPVLLGEGRGENVLHQ